MERAEPPAEQDNLRLFSVEPAPGMPPTETSESAYQAVSVDLKKRFDNLDKTARYLVGALSDVQMVVIIYPYNRMDPPPMDEVVTDLHRAALTMPESAEAEYRRKIRAAKSAFKAAYSFTETQNLDIEFTTKTSRERHFAKQWEAFQRLIELHFLELANDTSKTKQEINSEVKKRLPTVLRIHK